MKWINSGDIKNWVTSNNRGCAQVLPELVRRLVFATAGSIQNIEFPSGDSIATGGWDGKLKTMVISPFFPNGSSVWEISVRADAKQKAEEDYQKRTADPQGAVQSETTFVFVTPHPWPNREDWIAEKKAEGIWKDVKVINVDGIEQWLDSAPAVAIWLARQTKGLADGIRDIELVWEEWSLATSPKMTLGMISSGRIDELKRVREWLTGNPGILEVRGDSPDEPFAFLYAAIEGLSDAEKLRALSRCIVVDNIQQLRSCTLMFQNPLIIAAPAECREAAGAAVAKGHHVFLSADSRSIDLRNNLIELSRPQPSVVEQELINGGMPAVKAHQVARDFGRSIPVLRRHLFISSAKKPDWTEPTAARILIPVLLTGAWNENKEDDRKIIETLSGMTYENFIKELTPFLSIADSPIRKIGSVWMLKSPLDAWFLLAGHLTADNLKLFEQVLLGVLTKTDPKYDLSEDKRWAASMYGKSNPYSEWLYTGLVESLVLLAVYGDRSTQIPSTQTFADSVVRKIFTSAEKWEMWSSLKDVTPLLAEAAPEVFLEIVERGIKNSPELFEELMKDGGGMWGECRHSGLLWALESLGWKSDYLAQVANILLQLTNIDKGGMWSNRAGNSLKELFMPVLPQTHATPEERLSVLDVLISKDHAAVWKFAQAYFQGGSMTESHRFRWRDSGGNRRGLEQESNEDYNKYVKGLFPKLSDIACLKENVVATMADFLSMGPIIQERLIATLENENPDDFSKEDREKLLTETREALNWINSFDAEKKYQVYKPGLFRVLERFLPTNVLDRNGWLLGNAWPRLPDGDQRDYHANDAHIAKTREEAAREVLDQADLKDIFDYVLKVQYPGVYGHALGKAVNDDVEDSKVLDYMLSRSIESPGFVMGYAMGRVEKATKAWVPKQIKRIKEQGNYSAEAAALLHFGLPEGKETWESVDKEGPDVVLAYWKRARGITRSEDDSEAAIAVEKLLDAKRPAAALQVAGSGILKTTLPSSLLKRLLQELLESNIEEEKRMGDVMDEYHLEHVFKQLYDRQELSIEEIARLEWPYARVLRQTVRRGALQPALYKALQKDPSFFAQLIPLCWKRDDHAQEKGLEHLSEEQRSSMAENAWEVLHSWSILPGLKDDGTIDEKELNEWVDKARSLCEENQHTRGCDMQIGQLLSFSPGDSDGAWPHIAVRNLIERLNSRLIDDHIRSGIFNNRGVITRSINDGGVQERELSSKYRKMADVMKVKWPRTCAILNQMADWYESQAKSEDIDSDLQDLRWS